MILAALIVPGKEAGRKRWMGGRKRGERCETCVRVDGRADHDRISVGRDDGRFRELQIRVERHN
jgi:hypothetical protein